MTLSSDVLDSKLGEKDAALLREDVELVDGVHGELSVNDYLAGKIAPVFFGSAINNFGVGKCSIPLSASRPFHVAGKLPFVKFVRTKINSPASSSRSTLTSIPSTATGSRSSAFAPAGSRRNKYFHHVRLDKDVRFSNPYTFLARDKDVIDEAFPGDVVGLFDTGNFKIGDTLTEGANFYFTGIPSFSPEIFKEVVNKDPMKTKQLEKGLLQLTDEGVAQLFTQFGGNKKIIGCVGELQFRSDPVPPVAGIWRQR